MKRIAATWLLILAWLSIHTQLASGWEVGGARNTVTIYDSDPEHIWNRLYAALFVRNDQAGNAYGANALDPLLWPESKYLLEGAPRTSAHWECWMNSSAPMLNSKSVIL